MTTRLRAGPFVAMIAIIAATALSPLNAAATPNQTAIIAYGTAPNFLVPEVTSPPTAAWMNVTDAAAAVPNVVFGTNNMAATISPRAAPLNMATVTNSTVDFKTNFALGTARAVPATNDFKITAAWSIDAKKNSTIGARAAPAIKTVATGRTNSSSMNPATTAGG